MKMDQRKEHGTQYKDPRTTQKALTNFIAGAVGGAGSTSLSHPLDSVKVKMQTFPNLYRGGVHCITQVIKEDGVRGLYRGLVPGVTLSMTEASIRYMTYGICQDIVRKLLRVDSSEKMNLFHNACAGGMTGFLSTFASCPIELVKCRTQGMLEITKQSTSVQFRGPASVVVHVLRTDGIMGLYRGFISNVARNTPGELIFFATYEQCRQLARPAGQNKDAIGPFGSFLCGSCAGISYWVSIYPLDSVKSRVQVLSCHGKVPGMWATFVNIIKYEGVGKLYHGVGYCIPRAAIGSGSHFVFYETTRKLLLRNQGMYNDTS